MSQTAKEPSKNNNKNTAIYVVVALLLGGSVIYSKSKKKTDSSNSNSTSGNDSSGYGNGSVTVSPKPIAVYVTKILKIGSKGIEVTKLQALMKISADGFFGTQTEAMLFRLKGVKEISLDQYAKLPTFNRNILPNGAKVMVSNRNGAAIYGSIKKADNTYYSSGIIKKTIPFGQAVGVIRSASADGKAYTIFYNDLNSWSTGNAAMVGFVSAADIEKYS
jgi:hypothetical protein